VDPDLVTGTPALAARIAEAVARQATQDPPGLVLAATPEAQGGGLQELVSRARRESLLYRGFYAVAAVRRLSAAAILDGPGGLEQAIAREARYFQGHKDATTRRMAGANGVQVAATLYGVILGWYHLNPTLDPRPDHLDAHGHNFRAVPALPPAMTGVWPGVLPNCGCVAGPPHRDGELILALVA